MFLLYLGQYFQHSCLRYTLFLFVTDVLFLWDAIRAWHETDDARICLVLIGPQLDAEYARVVFHAFAEAPEVGYYVPPMSPEDVLAVMREADVVVRESM